MICKNCGFDNMEGANFCIQCGTRLEHPEEEAVVQESIPDAESSLSQAEKPSEAMAETEAGFSATDAAGYGSRENPEPVSLSGREKGDSPILMMDVDQIENSEIPADDAGLKSMPESADNSTATAEEPVTGSQNFSDLFSSFAARSQAITDGTDKEEEKPAGKGLLETMEEMLEISDDEPEEEPESQQAAPAMSSLDQALQELDAAASRPETAGHSTASDTSVHTDNINNSAIGSSPDLNTGLVQANPVMTASTSGRDGLHASPTAGTASGHGQTSQSKPAELWYYMDRDTAVGPFSVDEIFEKIHVGSINRYTYVWTRGLPDWIRLSQSPFDTGASTMHASGTSGMQQTPNFASSQASHEQRNSQNTAASAAAAAAFVSAAASGSSHDVHDTYAQPTAAESAVEWFCVQDSRSTGPYTPEVIAQMLNNGSINGSTYVWKEGMGDWEYLRNTELGKLLPGQDGTYWNRNDTRYQNPYADNNYASKDFKPGVGYVKSRSILLYILLCILTCGIWYFVWLWQIGNDVNELAAQQNKPKGVDPFIAVLLSVIGCNIYTVYYFYREGTVISQLDYPGYRTENQSVLLAILGFFIPVASMAILQDQINNIVKYGG